MKKQYLLALVASVALGMGAEAQTCVTPSIDPSNLNTEEIAPSTVKTGNGSALSATPRQAASGSSEARRSNCPTAWLLTTREASALT